MKKMTASIAVTLILSGSMVGCTKGSQVDRDPVNSGVIVERTRRSVTVLEDDGEKETHRHTKSVARRCSINERYPDCLR